MLHRLMRVLDWVSFIYVVSSIFIVASTHNVNRNSGFIPDEELSGECVLIWHWWYVPNCQDFLGMCILFMPIIYPALLILQYIVMGKVRILPWK